VVSPVARREVAGYLQANHRMSERRACAVAGLSRSVNRYRSRRCSEEPLRAQLRGLAAQYPRYGYLLLHGLLKSAGQVVNRKRTYRLYVAEGLQVKRRRRKRLDRPRQPMPVPLNANERWSMDFVSDRLASGRRFRVLNIVDDFTRECVLQVVDYGISGARITQALARLAVGRPLPPIIVCDNGPEFTSKAMFLWTKARGIRLHFIEPGKPMQNAFIESFNGKFRDACLNQHWFVDLLEARSEIKDWRIHYNEVRPHSALGYQPPAVFARNAA
jgi:putative transposase